MKRVIKILGLVVIVVLTVYTTAYLYDKYNRYKITHEEKIENNN